MRFLIDAQLPRRLAYRLREAGHDAVHTLDLPEGNRTTDAEINRRSVEERRVAVTKDADFVDALLVQDLPFKLLLISTGNIGLGIDGGGVGSSSHDERGERARRDSRGSDASVF
ncbi:MAG: DUF5615 family PIN-like protein [Bacteroidota bacterium]